MRQQQKWVQPPVGASDTIGPSQKSPDRIRIPWGPALRLRESSPQQSPWPARCLNSREIHKYLDRTTRRPKRHLSGSPIISRPSRPLETRVATPRAAKGCFIHPALRPLREHLDGQPYCVLLSELEALASRLARNPATRISSANPFRFIRRAAHHARFAYPWFHHPINPTQPFWIYASPSLAVPSD
jgi:hypothetical protein